MGRVRAALDASAARMLAPGWRARARAESLETLAMLEQALAERGGDEALIERIRRRRARLTQTV
jgi:hypothetical protein